MVQIKTKRRKQNATIINSNSFSSHYYFGWAGKLGGIMKTTIRINGKTIVLASEDQVNDFWRVYQ